MIIYFSGTGNSRYLADAMADRLGDVAVSANNYIKTGRKGEFQSDSPWIFVFPIYLSTIPKLFADFLRNSTFQGNRKAYFLATCASAMGSAPNVCAEFCKEKGLKYCGAAKVKMPQNYIVLFQMMDDEECQRRQEHALLCADQLSDIIERGSRFKKNFASKSEYAMTRWVEKLYNGPFTQTRGFHATDQCVGCGLCVKTCPLNKIEMEDGKPKWTGSCVHCMGCINRCPRQAIEFGRLTVGKRRYVCKSYHTNDR